ncbi:phosphotransferase enzyme family protein [Streptosporangium subroseum]|uniref:phosphotransferase enzyme family protein n=1 Tax=Streptosporangium subroseum TaxID=106412 RepID=UPI00308C7F3E|nr:phosphotransferase [Streptosporangium subroseum]
MPDITIPLAAERGDRMAAVLAGRYGLTARTITQLPIGQGTVNYLAVCDGGLEMFVKNYPAGADLRAEQAAITLSTYAVEEGIPGPQVLLNQEAEVIDASTPLAVSVWEWMPGHVVPLLSPPQLAEAGTALGYLHALFADLPGNPSVQGSAGQRWRDIDLNAITATIDQLLEVIARRIGAGAGDAFDIVAQRTLLERRDQLVLVPELLAGLPAELTMQVVHGDYSPVNLLFTGETLSAVLDFRPPDPFLLAYDLGRMAFYPNTVTGDPDWLGAAATLISAYQQAHPAVAAVDVRACGRVALLQLLKSLYGVRQHYLKPGLFQDDLDEFWLVRHRTVSVLLAELVSTETLLTGLAGT